MDDFIYNFVKTATTMQKGVFLMIAGMCFVFAVQVIFYIVTKIWIKIAPKSKED